MASTVSEPAALVDAGSCGWCSHGQWSHKLGKRGCKELGCPCGKYEPPKAGRVEIVGEPAERPADGHPGVCVGGFEPAQPGDVELPVEPSPDEDIAAGRTVKFDSVEEMDAALDAAPVVADPAAQAEHARQVAAIDAQLAEPGPTCAYPNGEDEGEHDHAMCEDVVAEREEARVLAEVERLTRERDGFEVQRDQAYERVDELNDELGRVRADRDKLQGQLDAIRTNARRERLAHQVATLTAERDEARQALKNTADAYLHTSIAAATNVLFRYDAAQCRTEGCGSRYTVPVEHPHPLTPVTVLVVRREVPSAA